MLAQVVIKDEIILNETESPDEETLPMPFYGNAFIRFITPGQKMRAYFTVDDQTKFLNEINGTTYNCGCGLPLWSMDVQWTVSDVPATSDVSLQVLQCQQVSPSPPPNGTCDWVELPVQFTEDSQTEDKWNISVNVNYPNTPPDWRSSGYILFTETTPPGCYACSENRDESCEECIDPLNLLPEINLVNAGNGFDSIDVCENDSVGAGFNVPGNGLVNYNFEMNACFNTQLQRWWFNIVGDTIHFRYILDFCNQNIEEMGGTLIEDYQNFPSEYGCENILRDLNNHYSNPVEISNGGYVLKSILEAHESQHLADFDTALNAEKEVLLQQLKDEEIKLCEDFGSVEDARQYWFGVFGPKIIDMWDRARENRLLYMADPDYENDTHDSIRSIIDQIREDALCYWGCEYLDPEIECP
jgi:hypothetical protein